MAGEITHTGKSIDRCIALSSASGQETYYPTVTSTSLFVTSEAVGSSISTFGTSTDSCIFAKSYAQSFLNFGTSIDSVIFNHTDRRFAKIPDNALLIEYA